MFINKAYLAGMAEEHKDPQEKYKKFREKIQKVLARHFIFVDAECFFLDTQYSKTAVRYVIPAIKEDIPDTSKTVFIPLSSAKEIQEIEIAGIKRKQEGEIEKVYTATDIKILENMAERIEKIKKELAGEGIKMFVAVENFSHTDFEKCRYGYSFVISKKRLSQL